jgi:lysophospholipase L1-like esterase
VPGLGGDVTAVAAGVDSSCAVRAQARVLCWGDNDFGQLGSGDAPADHDRPVPTAGWDDGRLRDRNGDGRIVIACLGDSNTQPTAALPRTWCRRLAEFAETRGWEVVDHGEGGATAVADGSMITADEHLAYALESDAADAVILAYGSNDVRLRGVTPTQVGHAYAQLWQRGHEAGIDVFVALTPPTHNGKHQVDAAIVELNEKLRQIFPEDRVIDFWSGFAPGDFFDEVHLGESGHARRAQLAWDVLRAAAGDAP